MNDLGSLATQIVTYSYAEEIERFPATFVSGWLDANIGLLNAVTHEEFSTNGTGAFEPYSLAPVEESIFKLLYDIYYNEKAAKYALRGVVWDNSLADSITLVKEGDSTIQKVSKHQIARTFSEMARAAEDSLNNIVFQYNSLKAAPLQVVGDNEDFFPRSWDNRY